MKYLLIFSLIFIMLKAIIAFDHYDKYLKYYIFYKEFTTLTAKDSLSYYEIVYLIKYALKYNYLIQTHRCIPYCEFYFPYNITKLDTFNLESIKCDKIPIEEE